MLGDSQLNVYVLDTHLTPRHRERLQAQVQTALRAMPRWVFDLLLKRVEELQVRSLPLIVEARPPEDPGMRFLSLGEIEGRPAARLTPKLTAGGIDWGHDLSLLVAKALAFLASPPPEDGDFWDRWRAAADADRLRDRAAEAEGWGDASDRDLFIEMFAAYALKPEHERWRTYAAARAFFEDWRASVLS